MSTTTIVFILKGEETPSATVEGVSVPREGECVVLYESDFREDGSSHSQVDFKVTRVEWKISRKTQSVVYQRRLVAWVHLYKI